MSIESVNSGAHVPPDPEVEYAKQHGLRGEDKKAIARRLGLNENATWADIFAAKNAERRRAQEQRIQPGSSRVEGPSSVESTKNRLLRLIADQLEVCGKQREHIRNMIESSRQTTARMERLLSKAERQIPGSRSYTEDLRRENAEVVPGLEDAGSILAADVARTEEQCGQVKALIDARPGSVAVLLQLGIVDRFEEAVAQSSMRIEEAMKRATLHFRTVQAGMNEAERVIDENASIDFRTALDRLRASVGFRSDIENK